MQIINKSFTIPNLGKHDYLDNLAEKAYENVRIDFLNGLHLSLGMQRQYNTRQDQNKFKPERSINQSREIMAD